MLIFASTLKASFKTNKNALSFTKRKLNQNQVQDSKIKFEEVFFKNKTKNDFSKVL